MQEQIYLRKLILSDVTKKYLSWMNDLSVTEYLVVGEKPLRRNDLIKYIKDSKKNNRYNYAIITKLSEKHIGNCSIQSIKLKQKTFEIGWFIGDKKFWGGHYASMVIFNLLKIGFTEMNLNKCVGQMDEKHIKARMTNRFSGYKEIKKYNRYWKKINRNITEIKIEILKKDWLKNAKLLNSKFPKLYDI